MTSASTFPDQGEGHHLVVLLQGVTYAMILATLVIVLSPVKVEIFAVVTVAAVIYGVARAIVGAAGTK